MAHDQVNRAAAATLGRAQRQLSLHRGGTAEISASTGLDQLFDPRIRTDSDWYLSRLSWRVRDPNADEFDVGMASQTGRVDALRPTPGANQTEPHLPRLLNVRESSRPRRRRAPPLNETW